MIIVEPPRRRPGVKFENEKVARLLHDFLQEGMQWAQFGGKNNRALNGLGENVPVLLIVGGRWRRDEVGLKSLLKDISEPSVEEHARRRWLVAIASEVEREIQFDRRQWDRSKDGILEFLEDAVAELSLMKPDEALRVLESFADPARKLRGRSVRRSA